MKRAGDPGPRESSPDHSIMNKPLYRRRGNVPRIILITGPRNGKFPESNCLLVKDPKTSILVDSGCGEENVKRLRDKIDAIVYTHIHPDHITYHHLLEGKPTYIPVQDQPYQTLEELAKRYAPEIWKHWIKYAENVFKLEQPPTPQHVYESWQPFKIKNIEITPIPAQGHTRGHHMLLIDDNLHLSDIDLTRFGPWYGHPESSIQNFINDINLAKKIEAKTTSTSHIPNLYTKNEANKQLENYLNKLEEQITKVLDNMTRNTPLKPADLAGKGIIYRKYLPAMETVMNYFETQMIHKILEHLAYHGHLQKTHEGYIKT
ncbi:MAG: MBL fold metallo-hydrolase [Desulfurococcales archaeon]|nr:MBL fold metallo-hydrolase [Desulfurococcales archaeon]